MRRHGWRLAAGCLLLGAVFGCSDGSDSYAPVPEVVFPAAPTATRELSLNPYGVPELPAVLHEADIDPGRSHHPGQVSVFHTDDAGRADTGDTGFDEAWWYFSAAESVELCVDDTGDPGHYLELYDAASTLLATIANGGCETLELGAGDYLYRVYHGAVRGTLFMRAEAATTVAVASASSSQSTRRLAGGESQRVTATVSDADLRLRRLISTADRPTTLRISAGNCPGCNLTGLQLDNVDLSGADLQGAILGNASLEEVNLSGANLAGADFRQASLASVNLQGADLSGTSFEGATLSSSNLADVQVGEYLPPETTFSSAPAVTGTSTGLPALSCYGQYDRPSPFGRQSAQGRWEGASACPGNNAYLLVTALADNGYFYQKRWDAKHGRGWDGWSALPRPPQTPISAPAAVNDGQVGSMVVAYLAEDNTLWHSWRHITTHWAAWAPLGRPDGVRLVSGPAGSHGMVKADYLETPAPPAHAFSIAYGPFHRVYSTEHVPQGEFYLAAVGESEQDASERAVWVRSWISCGDGWNHSPGGDACDALFEPGVTCVGAVGLQDSRWQGTADWCDFGAPAAGIASAPGLAYLDEHDLVMLVLGQDGQLYHRGFGRDASHSRDWQALPMPPLDDVGVNAAPGLGNAGHDGVAVVSLLDDSGVLWAGSLLGGSVTYQQLATPAQAEIVHAPDLESYGAADRTYLAVVGRSPGGASPGDFFASNFFYREAAQSDRLNDQFGHPGNGEGAAQASSLRDARVRDTVVGFSLSEITVQGADFDSVNLAQSDLDGADLRGAKITNSDLAGLDLRNARLLGADLSGSNLAESLLDDVVLGEADGNPACRSEVNAEADDPTQACLEGTDLRDASLYGTDFSGIDVRAAQFDAEPLIEYLYVPFGGAIDAAQCDDVDIYAQVSGNDRGARNPATIQRTRLVGATLTPGQFSPRTWRSLDLAGATITDLGDASLAGLDYSDASMAGLTLRLAEGERADFSDTLFRHADLEGFNLRETTPDSAEPATADFSGSCLLGATMDGADLRHSDFTDASLEQVSAARSGAFGTAIFDRAVFLRARLVGGGFDEASFGRADLREVDASGGVSFRGGNFSHANFLGADLRQAVFSVGDNALNTSLPYVFLKNANLANAEFIGADLSNAYLYGPTLNLADVDFSRADLSDAYLVGADFSAGDSPRLPGTRLDGAVLVNADLTGADLRPAELASDAIRASLVQARLQGTRLGGAILNEAVLTDAVLCGPGQSAAETSECLQPISLERIDYRDDAGFESVTEDIEPLEATDVSGVQTRDARCPDGSTGGQDGCSDEQWRFSEPPPEREPVDPNAW